MKAKYLTCRLLNEGETHQTALKDPNTLNVHLIKDGLNFTGAVAIPNQFANKPGWVEIINSCVDDEIQYIENKSSRAVLFVNSGDRVLAFTFGQGRHLINPDVVVNNFGLKVALNSIDPEQMRSIDAKTIDERTMNTRKQSSKTSALETFGLNISKDLIKAVNGIPRDKDFAKNITGAEALAFSAEFEIENLGSKCEEIIEMYGKEIYKERFSWIDNLQSVKNKIKIAQLDNSLITSLQSGDFENIYLAPPEIIEWQEIQGFKFSNSRDQEDIKIDLKIEDYLNNYTNPADINIENLKNKDRATMICGDNFETNWSIYKCLVYEVTTEDGLYVLTEGNWYKIASDFVQEINNKVMEIPLTDLNLPSAGNGEREDAYNTRAANGRADICLFDKETVSPESGQSKIEFCDLFTANKQMVHVKKRSSSATLSHLFAQGRISALTFLDHQGFRQKIREKITEINPQMVELIPIVKPTTSEFEIVYAIISGIVEDNWQLKLPFFSRLNLVETCKDLERLGFKISLSRIMKERI